MLPKGLSEQGIRKLAEIGETIYGVKIQLPTKEQQEEAKAEIESILPPEKGYVTIPFVRQVLIGLEYAKTHYFCPLMLDDIIAGKEIKISDYKKIEEGRYYYENEEASCAFAGVVSVGRVSATFRKCRWGF